MSLSPADWRASRISLAVLALTLLLGSGFVYITNQMIEAANLQWQQQQNTLREAHQRFQQSGDEAATILRYLPPYQKLQRRGIIGPEQRINWLDGLRAANQQAQLFGIEYQLGAQQPYAGVKAADGPPLYQSTMKLNFRMLHEEDLMRFFNALEQQQAGLFKLDQCLLERVSNPVGVRMQPNLRAVCELSWITVHPGAAK